MTGLHAGLLQGLWWLPAAGEALGAGPTAGSAAAAAAAAGDAELLRLAAAARMNTDVRRAVFCCVMGAEDASDAFERLLRLGLKVRRNPAGQCQARPKGAKSGGQTQSGSSSIHGLCGSGPSRLHGGRDCGGGAMMQKAVL
jgi:hypothetical protein